MKTPAKRKQLRPEIRVTEVGKPNFKNPAVIKALADLVEEVMKRSEFQEPEDDADETPAVNSKD